MVNNALDIEALKIYLRIDGGAEDGYINILILLSAEICANYLRAALPATLIRETEY